MTQLLPFFFISIITLWYGLYASLYMSMYSLGLTTTVSIGLCVVLMLVLCVVISTKIMKHALTPSFSIDSNYFGVAFIGLFYLVIMQATLALGIDFDFCINYTLIFFFCYIVFTPSLFVGIVNFLAHPVVLGSLVSCIIVYFKIKYACSIYCAEEVTSSASTVVHTPQRGVRDVAAKCAGWTAEQAVQNLSINSALWAGSSAYLAKHAVTEMRGAPLSAKMLAAGGIFAAGIIGKHGGDFVIRKIGVAESHGSPAETISSNDVQRGANLLKDRYGFIKKDYPAQSPLEAGDGLSIWTVLTTPFSLSFNSSFFESYFNTVFYTGNLLLFAITVFFLFMFLEYLFSRYYKEENTDTANFVKRYWKTALWLRDIVLIVCYVVGIICIYNLMIFGHMDISIAKACSIAIKEFHNLPAEYHLSHRLEGYPIEYYEKTCAVIILVVIGFYRSYYLVNPKPWKNITKGVVVFVSGIVTRLMLACVSREVVDSKEQLLVGKTLFTLFNTYNSIVYYAFIFLIVIGVAFVISNFTEKWVTKQIFYSHTVIAVDIFNILLQVLVGSCFLCVSLAIMYICLFTLPVESFGLLDRSIRFTVT